MILMGALVAFVCAAVFAALLGTGAPSAGADAACPNEAIRAAQHATQVGDCRAFEMVSPLQKGGGDIIGEGLSTVAAADGNGAIFESRLIFGDAFGSGNVGRTAYLARRGADGEWSSHGFTPESRPDAIQVLTSGTKTEVFSDDLSRALVWAYDLPGATDDPPELNNFYEEDTATGALQTISKTQDEPISFIDFFNRTLWGASDDLRHVGVVATSKLLPEAAGGAPNAYKWDDGVLSLAGVLPDGTVPAGGSTIEPIDTRETMSEDGCCLAFFSGGQLYLHVDGQPSAWVSQPEGTDKNPPSNVHFEGMTPDGKSVFFVSESPLLDADEASGPDLYRYTESANPVGDSNLTLITNDGGAVNNPTVFGGALVGMSDDGSRVYVHDIAGRVDLWEEGTGIKTVDPFLSRTPELAKHLALTATPGASRVSANGEWLAYLAGNELRLYSLTDDSRSCVSCPSNASIFPTVTHSGRVDYVGFRPRFLTDDGRVFFTSTGALVPEDTNGVADVYEYDGPQEKLKLVTSGRGSEPMEFTDASASGDDVFFVTRQRLVTSDTDDYVDLYDARVGGGVEEPEVPAVAPCSGDSCQGAGSGPAAVPAIGSGAATRGNLHRGRPRCAKNKREVRRQGKVRCIKKHRQHRRDAGTGRGGQK